MKVTVVALSATEARKAREGLAKLGRSVRSFRRDWKDQRVDVDTVESFVRKLRITADYFDSFLVEEVKIPIEEVNTEPEREVRIDIS